MRVNIRSLSLIVVIWCISQVGPSQASAQDSSSKDAPTRHTITRVEPGAVGDLAGISKVFVYTGDKAALRDAVIEKLSIRQFRFVDDVDQADVIILITNADQPLPADFGLPAKYKETAASGGIGDWTGTVLRQRGRDMSRVVIQISEATGENAVERLAAEFLTAFDAVND